MKSIQVANFLKTLREKEKLTQRSVAYAMGYSTPQFISNWERGVSYPPATALKKLSRLYKVDSSTIFEEVLKAALEKTEADLRKQFARSK